MQAKPRVAAAAIWIMAMTGIGYAPIAAADVGQLIESDADVLRPGQYRWSPAARGEGPVALVVSIPAQALFVYRSGQLVGVSSVSTGMRGHETPAGTFPVLQKRLFHRSNLYSNAPMPFMQRLTWTGIALHAGALPGHPASHGCIRLPRSFAQDLFALTEIGSLTFITHYDHRLPEDSRTPAMSAPRLDYASLEF